MIYTYQKPLKGKSVGIVFGSFAPLHQGHLDAIMRAKRENDGGCIVIVCGYDGDKGEPLMPHNKRYRYVREYFADDDLVAVYAINDTAEMIPMYPDGWKPWLEVFDGIWNDYAIAHSPEDDIHNDGYLPYIGPKRVWYVGDQNYYDELTWFGETAVLLDRAAHPICATMIRENPVKHWNKIAYPFKRVFSHNILICGTASEGKSTLTIDLGKYFNSPYSYEWARDYMKESNVSDWELDAADFMAFLQGQYDLNKKLINSPANNGIFFADSDSMVTRMYAEYYANDGSCALKPQDFEKIAIVADELTSKCRWDKIFLLAPKGVFVDDHTRYMAHSGMKERQELFNILCDNIKTSGNWDKVTILQGGYYKNFTDIVDYVNKEVIKND